MRGQAKSQPQFLALFSTEQAVPKDRPIRTIKRMLDGVLKDLSPLIDAMYAKERRPSIPPERLLKAKLLTALFSVTSPRYFCGQLCYNPLFRWFLDIDMSDGTFHASSVSENQERLIRHNAARLCFAFHALIENRSGLLRRIKVTSSTEATEPETALAMVREEEEVNCITPKTVGGDKGYHTREFVQELCGAGTAPHVARRKHGERLDQVVTASDGYRISQRVRKRVEEIFGWAKTVGGQEVPLHRDRPDATLRALHGCGLQPGADGQALEGAGHGLTPPINWPSFKEGRKAKHALIR